MSIKVQMTNPATGDVKKIKVGFSWTVFFFGIFPFLFRGMVKHFFIWWLIGIFTAGLSNFYLMFAINRKTALYWHEKGYRPSGTGWDYASAKWNLPNLKVDPLLKTASA